MKITIPLKNGHKLVVEVCDELEYSKEIFVGLEDKEGVCYQDIACIRPKPDDDGEDYQSDLFEVYVYADENSEDYTDSYNIKRYNGEY